MWRNRKKRAMYKPPKKAWTRSFPHTESESHSAVSDSLRPIQFMEFSRPEYWRGYPFPSLGDLPNPGITLRSSALQADSLPAELWRNPPSQYSEGIAPPDTLISDFQAPKLLCEEFLLFKPFCCLSVVFCYSFSDGAVVKNLPANVGDKRDMGSLPGSGRSPGGGHSNPPRSSCLENPTDRGAWWATVHGVT